MSTEAHEPPAPATLGSGVTAKALTLSDVKKSFAGVPVLKGVSFSVPAGEVVGLIGENGAGKSTLSSIIAGIHEPTEGSMTLDGEPYRPTGPVGRRVRIRLTVALSVLRTLR